MAKVALVALAAAAVWVAGAGLAPQPAAAYPFWAQQTAPETPREDTGRIVCANCHLAQKEAEVAVPQSVTPDSVFKAVVEIPYDTELQQVMADGSRGELNVGAVLMLPEGFEIAPEERIPEAMQEEVGDVFFQPYSADKPNIVLVGPLSGKEHQEIAFPVLSPDPEASEDRYYGKFPVYLGANRGRGQLYPDGSRSNNAVQKASASGTIAAIAEREAGGYEVTIQPQAGEPTTDTIPAGPEPIVTEGDAVEAGDALTENPNVGGFGQEETEIVLQDPTRIKWLMGFLGLIALAQIFLILKKRQVERMQAAEMDL